MANPTDPVVGIENDQLIISGCAGTATFGDVTRVALRGAAVRKAMLMALLGMTSKQLTESFGEEIPALQKAVAKFQANLYE